MTKAEPTTDPKVTPELVAKHGLTPEEFERIKKILGREPNFTELGIFSVMWSEHCSYKNSRLELKKFPTTGPNILVKAGEENAGVVDIGDGWAIAFKMESHNHPSAIEPFQGAATGVGGIIRDIFTMGARPEFCLNSLRFGPISEDTRSSMLDTGSKAGNGSIEYRESSIENRREPAALRRRRFAASRITEIASGFRQSAARFISTKALKAIRWSTFFVSACCGMINSHAAPRAELAIRFFTLALKLVGTVWPARRLRRANSPKNQRKTGPQSRSAIHLKKSFCSRPVSSCSRAMRWPEFRTWARPA